MPTFPTPQPVAVSIQLAGGDVRLVASDRDDTVVEVRPRNAAKAADRQAAEVVDVELDGSGLSVKAPRTWRHVMPFGQGGMVEVDVQLPSGSQLDLTSGMGKVQVEGRLGVVRIRSAMGDLTLDHVGSAQLKTAYGDVRVDHVVGDLAVHTASGALRLGHVGGAATVRTGNGDTTIDRVDGDLRVKSANGNIDVARAMGSVVTKTANGRVRLGEVVEGQVSMATAAGDLDIGVAEGTAAWLDLHSQFGDVRSELEAADGPGAATRTVKVQAKTAYGDVVVRRSPTAASDADPAAA